ncbi:MAG: hypothetical protein KJ902_00730 [Candidatus Omnitrophica bacterium]|nr:hypothetical protein [Candidatus Omnitrophota bacterium]
MLHKKQDSLGVFAWMMFMGAQISKDSYENGYSKEGSDSVPHRLMLLLG